MPTTLPASTLPSMRALTRFAVLAPLLWCLAAIAHAFDTEASLVKIRAVAADGSATFGSAVVIGPEKIATACHVTRHATRIEISHGDERWLARSETGSPTHDLCILSVADMHLPAVTLRRSQDLALGERMIAAGFEHGGAALVTAAGTVKNLYLYDGGAVIRTSAAFDFGSSGGGLFDEAGRLVGLLAFRARTGTDLRFALPSEWMTPESAVTARFEPVGSATSTTAFWERPSADRPEFLGVALHEAREAAR